MGQTLSKVLEAFAQVLTKVIEALFLLKTSTKALPYVCGSLLALNSADMIQISFITTFFLGAKPSDSGFGQMHFSEASIYLLSLPIASYDLN